MSEEGKTPLESETTRVVVRLRREDYDRLITLQGALSRGMPGITRNRVIASLLRLLEFKTVAYTIVLGADVSRWVEEQAETNGYRSPDEFLADGIKKTYLRAIRKPNP